MPQEVLYILKIFILLSKNYQCEDETWHDYGNKLTV